MAFSYCNFIQYFVGLGKIWLVLTLRPFSMHLPLPGVAPVPPLHETGPSSFQPSGALMFRCLLLLATLIGLSHTAFAEICCPGGCVQDGARCVRTGPTPSSCPVQACPQHRPGGSQGGSGKQSTTVYSLPSRKMDHVCCDATRAPGGSYTKTCRDFKMNCVNANELSATCGSGHGWVRSTLPNVNSCMKIENIDGQLKCKKRAQRPRGEC